MKLSCGGLRDETDLRGHNRTWKGAQPGWILRQMRDIGSKDPVVVLDEIDKLGRAPAAVLLEVLDPAQHARFRDAFVELPFDRISTTRCLPWTLRPSFGVSRNVPVMRKKLIEVALPLDAPGVVGHAVGCWLMVSP